MRLLLAIAIILGIAHFTGGDFTGAAVPSSVAASDPACYIDYTLPCTTEQYQKLAERNCAMMRAAGDDCRIETLPDGTEPHAVRTLGAGEDQIPLDLIQQIATDPALTHPAWTQPSAVYTVTTPNHPGQPCVLNSSCVYQSIEPSQITVFTHAGNPDEGPTYGADYCHEQMVEAAPGTTCTVRPDPLDLEGD